MENIESTGISAEQVEVVTPQEESTESTQTIEQSEPETSVTEEVAEPQQEKPVQSKEDNARFAEVRRKAEAEARDKLISEMYGDSHGIHSYADYQQAVEQQAEAERRAQLQEQGIDPSIVDQYVSNNPVVKKAAELIQQQEQQQKQARDYGEFLDYFKSENGRDYNAATDTIPNEVWAAVAQGKTLADAYARHDSRQLRAKLKAFEANKVNAASSPGSVTGNGTSTSELTVEMINNMSSQEQMRHWGEIKKVLKMK